MFPYLSAADPAAHPVVLFYRRAGPAVLSFPARKREGGGPAFLLLRNKKRLVSMAMFLATVAATETDGRKTANLGVIGRQTISKKSPSNPHGRDVFPDRANGPTHMAGTATPEKPSWQAGHKRTHLCKLLGWARGTKPRKSAATGGICYRPWRGGRASGGRFQA